MIFVWLNSARNEVIRSVLKIWVLGVELAQFNSAKRRQIEEGFPQVRGLSEPSLMTAGWKETQRNTAIF